ncbi:tetratricopeptide repeat protein [Limnospira indica]|uniref:tetratricopeptide repeat protein n=1 Tax=Limnospira indica TaxID=147322 RepID=UPI002353E2F2|nr:tetratricopeptide repeat protein [Limnospira indica]
MTNFYGCGTMGDGFGIALVWGVSELVSDLVRGNQLLRSGKLEEAVDAFQKAIALQHFIPISQDFSNPARVVVGGL